MSDTAEPQQGREQKYAIALAIPQRDGQYLFLKRGAGLEEFPGFWSLPSATIGHDDFLDCLKSGTLGLGAESKIKASCFERISFDRSRILKKGVRRRPDYDLEMILLEAHSSSGFEISKKKYQSLQMLEVSSALEKNRMRGGAFMGLLAQWMLETEAVLSPIRFLEVQGAGQPMEDDFANVDPVDLWVRAAGDYGALKSDKTGTDGAIIRKAMLDNYFELRCRALIDNGSTILDIGCGEGELLKSLSEDGFDAVGIDPTWKGRSIPTDLNIYPLEAETLSIEFSNRKFDLVVLNLVIQWLPDLDKIASQVAGVLSDGGRVIVSVVTPEFNRNGNWGKRGTQYTYTIDQPLRRTSFLTMVSRSAGPVQMFPYSTLDVLNSFARHSIFLSFSEMRYIDSDLSPHELRLLLDETPFLERYALLPLFTVIEFQKF